MNDDVIADLKQFITGLITQQTADLRKDTAELRHEATQLWNETTTLRQDMHRLEAKVDDGFTAIAAMLEEMHTRNESQDVQLVDHASRIARLEHKVV